MKTWMSVFFSLLILSFTSQSVGKPNSTLKLAGNLKDFVQWSPISPSHRYQEQLPQTDKIAEFEKLGYGYVTLTERHDILLKDDKTVEETVTNTQLYISTSGISDSGSSGFYIDTNTQRVEIQEAYVLQPDGTRVEVDPGTLQVSTDNTPYIFNDYIFVTVPFPQLKLGSISVLVYKAASDRKKSPLPWSRFLYPANFVHIENFQVQVTWANQPLKPVWQKDYAKLDCSESALNMRCVTKQASPPIPTDQDMPSPYDILPVIELAEPITWADLSTAMQKLTESALSNSEKIKQLSQTLTKDATEPQEKLNRILSFVAREIRYVGIEHDRNTVVPKPTLTTLERKYGDCKDKTMLFIDLARQAGLDAYPVLTSFNRHSLAKLLLPASSYFNHMIACVKLSPTNEPCVDLTDTESTVDHLSQSLQGAVSLTIGRGTTAPSRLASEPYTWKQEITGTNRFTNQGTIVEIIERNYNSHWAAGLRHNLASKSQVDRNRWLLENYRTVMTDKVLPAIHIEGLDDPKANLSLISTTEFPNSFNPSQFNSFGEIDLWLRDLAKSLKTKNTHYPYVFQGVNYKSQLTYQLNLGKKVSNLGPKISYSSRWGEFFRSYERIDDNNVTVYTELKMPRTEVPVEEIEQFNRFLDLTSLETRIWFGVQ